MSRSTPTFTLPKTSRQLLDEAYESMREVMHRGGSLSPKGRELCSLAMAFCREAYIDCDGQNAQQPEAVYSAHAHFRAIEAALVARDASEEGGAA